MRMSSGNEPPVRNIEVDCPHCSERLSLHPSEAGNLTVCPQCGGKFQVPVPSARLSGAAYGAPVDPAVREFAEKKIAAGIRGILLGQFGIHKFILGLHTPAVIMLVTTCFSYILGSCLVVPYLGVGVMAVIGVVEGVLYLLKSDEEFYETYAVRRKEWF